MTAETFDLAVESSVFNPLVTGFVMAFSFVDRSSLPGSAAVGAAILS